jgi:hypothetical protein
MVRPVPLTLLTLLGMLTACDGPKCDPITGCDIRSDQCQREALRLAACLRGSSADSQVQVEVVDFDTYLDEQVRAAEQEEPELDDVEMRAGLTRFQLSVPLDSKADRQRGLQWGGAFYDSRADRVTVLDRGYGGAEYDRGQTILLVHEMTHALQGADGLFDAIYEPVVTQDAALATSGLIEGEATLVEDRALTEALGFDFDDIHYARALASYRKSARQALLEADDLFVGARSGIPYAYGASLMYEAFREGGASAVADKLLAPLTGARELLGKTASKARVKPAIPERAGAVLVGSYHLGAFFFDAFLHRMDASAPDVLSHVLDDTFSVQRLANGELLSAWRLRFDDSIDSRDVASFIEDHTSISYRLGSDDPQDLWILREPDDAVGGEPPTFARAPEVDFRFSAPEASARVIECDH